MFDSMRQRLLLFGFICLHLSFYVSALSTDHMQFFFPFGTIQDEKELDYSQLPNGAKTYFEGGSLVGRLRPYPILYNVYHPATTIVLGGILQLVSQPTGFVLYTLAKLPLTALMFYLICKKYRNSDNLLLASFVFFAFWAQAIEIGCGQYHFLLNLFIFFYLWGELSGKSELYGAACIFAALMIKPLVLLWMPLQLQKRKFTTVFWPLCAFVILTGLFYLDTTHDGHFYVLNLFERTTVPLPRYEDWTLYSLTVMLDYLGMSDGGRELLKYAVAGLLLLAIPFLRISLFSGLFLWLCYYLSFYSMVFDYHYTTLIPFFVLGVLTQKDFQSPLAKTCIVLSCLPSPYFLFSLLGLFDAGSRMVQPAGVFIIMCFRVLPVLAIALWIVGSAVRLRWRTNGT